MVSSGITLKAGVTYDVDILMLATGFKAENFLSEISVIGPDGITLQDLWKSTLTTFLGVTPALPNFAILYGPNTNLGHNPIMLMIEPQSCFIIGLVAPVLEARKKGKALRIRPRKNDYNDEIQARPIETTFASNLCRSWHKNADGTVTNNWFGTVIEYQQRLSKIRWSDFELESDTNMGGSLCVGETALGRVEEERSPALDLSAKRMWIVIASAAVTGLALSRPIF